MGAASAAVSRDAIAEREWAIHVEKTPRVSLRVPSFVQSSFANKKAAAGWAFEGTRRTRLENVGRGALGGVPQGKTAASFDRYRKRPGGTVVFGDPVIASTQPCRAMPKAAGSY